MTLAPYYRALEEGAHKLNWEYRFWDIAVRHAIDIGQKTGVKQRVRGVISKAYGGARRWVIEPVRPKWVCERCANVHAVSECCSAHGKLLCHGCYRRTHFVEVCARGCRDCAAEGLPAVMA